MKLFSNDWADTLRNKINLNQEYKNSSENLSIHLILSDRSNNQSIILELVDSECKLAKTAEKNDCDAADFIIEAENENWQKILSRSISAMQALMMKKLIIKKGNMSELLPYVNALKELLNSAMEIKTEF